MKKPFRAQSTLEFIMITILVLAGIVVMGPYVIRSVNAYMRSWEISAEQAQHDYSVSANVSGCSSVTCEGLAHDSCCLSLDCCYWRTQSFSIPADGSCKKRPAQNCAFVPPDPNACRCEVDCSSVTCNNFSSSHNDCCANECCYWKIIKEDDPSGNCITSAESCENRPSSDCAMSIGSCDCTKDTCTGAGTECVANEYCTSQNAPNPLTCTCVMYQDQGACEADSCCFWAACNWGGCEYTSPFNYSIPAYGIGPDTEKCLSRTDSSILFQCCQEHCPTGPGGGCVKNEQGGCCAWTPGP